MEAEDFTEEMLDNHNQDVDDMCGCLGKKKTRSNRVLQKNHEDWCFYFMHVNGKDF